VGDEMERNSGRVVWVDNVKILACTLVVLGHFFQSMVKSSILPGTDLYRWFEQTVYGFHVQLFFICSGYLYQRNSRVDSVRAWKDNVLRKMIGLGVPYVTFSTVTWGLKTLFSDSVNNPVGGVEKYAFC
jgi:fucose 4-O-acetylase-like acetyltransferase